MDTAFDFAAAELERVTTFTSLEARGTLRIALKEAGLNPALVKAELLAVVVQKVLPELLRKRGVADAERVCATLRQALALRRSASDSGPASPADVLRRIRGS